MPAHHTTNARRPSHKTEMTLSRQANNPTPMKNLLQQGNTVIKGPPSPKSNSVSKPSQIVSAAMQQYTQMIVQSQYQNDGVFKVHPQLKYFG